MEDRVIGGVGGFSGDFAALLSKYIGETVTIFTNSGGQSGSGFTGVILAVNPVFVRLITRIGPAPGCALGNACTGFGVGNEGFRDGSFGHGAVGPSGIVGAASAGGWNCFPVCTLGSVTDIPICAIVSFVHNAV